MNSDTINDRLRYVILNYVKIHEAKKCYFSSTDIFYNANGSK